MLSFSCFLFAILAVSAVSAQDPNVECFKCKNRRNNKDLYAHPTDCHKYYQCFYSGEEGQAIGVERDCASGTFWSERILQCIPEGDTPCADSCMQQSVNFKGTYADANNCAAFFKCSNWISYPFCCSPGSGFNADTGRCEASETCTDVCFFEEIPQVTPKAVELFPDHCIDSWDNEIFPDADPAFFRMVDKAGAQHRLECARGSSFSLEQCSCAVHEEIPVQDAFKKCSYYFSFDGDVKDRSVHNFHADLVGNASIDADVFARGSGSLHTSGGWLELPFTKGVSSRTHSQSICLFFRCENPPCSFTSGGILSDRERHGSNNFGCVKYFANNTLSSDLNCLFAANDPVKVTVPGIPLPQPSNQAPQGFLQHCLLSDNEKISLYIDNQRIPLPLGDSALRCNFKPSECPFMLGFDQNYGAFNGYIDEFLLCPFDIGEEGVTAHWQGEQGLRAAELIP